MELDYESRGYLLDDFRLFHLSDAQGTRVDFHYHEFCKLLLLRSGSGGYVAEGRRYALETGDIVLIGHHCVHRPEFQPGVPYERMIIYISPEFLRSRSTADCDLLEIFSGEPGHVLRLEEQDRRQIFRLASRLEQEMSAGDYGSRILSGGLLLHLLVEIGRARRTSPREIPAPPLTENSRVADILAYLDAHLTEDLSIDALAEEFYVSKYHMMRLFRQETGQTIHGYLLDKRLLHARSLIARGLSATESCFRSGFRSYSSFTRAYGRRFGTTPTGRSTQLEETYE